MTEKTATRQVKRQYEFELLFDSNGIHPRRYICKQNHYKEIFGHLRDSFHRKRPELWHRKNWLLLHDNAPAYWSVLVQEELARLQVTILPHPPYPRDLAPCDFCLFPCMKALLRGHIFHSAEEVMIFTREDVWDLLANKFQRCFQQLYQCWQMCIVANSDYFEGGCGSF